jgi:predicted O-methyltransferase YrrM
MLAIAHRIRFVYLAYFSSPPPDRTLYRVIRCHGVRKILEIGVGTGLRAMRMIELAGQEAAAGDVHYTGIDLFEARSAGEGPVLSLKTAHQTLSKTGARIRLCPGSPHAALSRTANSLERADLVVIAASSGLSQDDLGRAWFFLPRVLHPASLVYMEEEGGLGGQPPAFRQVPLNEIETRASAALRHQRAA